ncbi:integrase core domain-containing protein [Yoonia sp. SS1-5]|uniref:Integrase core domain-containing protein n=1 Tax=Yoonia rhodophyticola TaxID=3137370 RepID=A0ABZ3JD25_9RHOB
MGPGKPRQNTLVKWFNGRPRDFLNEEVCDGLGHVHRNLVRWRYDYNNVRARLSNGR